MTTEESHAKYRELLAEHEQKQLRNIAVIKATLIKKIKVLLSHGYVPIGVVAPDCDVNSYDCVAGYLAQGVCWRHFTLAIPSPTTKGVA
jgi:hypothetical protein